MSSGAGSRGRALRRVEFERAFGVDEVLLPSASSPPPAPPAPGEDTLSHDAVAASPAPPDAPDAAEAKREAGSPAARKRPGSSRSAGAGAPRAAAAEPGPEEEIIVINSDAHQTGDLFESDSDEFGERVPEVSSSGMAPAEALAELKEWTLGCQRCPLAGTRTNVVFGEGSPEARLVFVGEAPGADEDATGRPFVGRAGQLLEKIIKAMGLEREQVFICNILKCRPPGNRTPGPREVAACSPLLREQLKILKPEVIVALGGPAAKTLLESKLGISKLRGRFHVYNGVPLMPTFHPAYLLRNPGEQYKRMVWDDMKAALAKLGLEAPPPPPKRGRG